MRVLAVEPYFGGSHRSFLEGWASRSRHTFVFRTLAGHHWKWRMRLGAVELAEGLKDAVKDSGGVDSFDVVWCSSMLDVALWRGVVDRAVGRLPHVVYYHENQFAYPTAPEKEADVRDLHFGLTNLTSAWAALESGRPWRKGMAARLWWNSAYNRDTFVGGAGDLLGKSPAKHHGVMQRWLPRINAACAVEPPGITLVDAPRKKQIGEPMRIAWAARWEHDKQPEAFFRAMHALEGRGVDFRLSVMGERFNLVPGVFEQAEEHFAARIDRWGYVPDRKDYERALAEADVFVSTAAHEFFGLAAVEAASAGCSVVLPRRLAYPEVFGEAALYYDDEETLVETLADLAHTRRPRHAGVRAKRYGWDTRAKQLDAALEAAGKG